MSLRILHIADVMPSPNSGAAGTDYQGVLALRRAGHQVREVWADELSHHIRHYNLRYLLELPRAYRSAMLAHMTLAQFDVVQISQPHGYLAARTIAERGAPPVFVHRSHGFEPKVRDDLALWHQRYPEPQPVLRKLARVAMSGLLERNNRLIAKYADGHLVSASKCADYLESAYGVARQKIAAIPQAVPSSFLVGAKPVDQSRLSRILYVGQYAFIKAPMILGAVVSRLLEQRPHLSFTWVCSAQHHAAAARHFSPSVLNRVTFLDWMAQDQLIAVYDRHGVFIFPSFFEGFGKAFLEAMSRGLVVIAADNGGAHDVITHGVDGYKAATGDIEATANLAARVLEDAHLAGAVSARSLLTASKFTWDQFARESTLFYEDLIQQKKFDGADGRCAQ